MHINKEGKNRRVSLAGRIFIAVFMVLFVLFVSAVILSVTGSLVLPRPGLLLLLFALLLFADVVSLAIAHKRHVSDLLFSDAVTGIPNWDKMREVVRSRIPAGTSGDYAFVVVDIDHFRMMNETFGIAECNRVLRIAAAILNTGLGKEEFTARIGSDTFGLLLKSADFESLIERLKSWNDRVVSLVKNETQIFSLSLSWGVYLVDDVTLRPSTISDRALMAMRTEKERFGCTYVFYSDYMREKLMLHSRIENSMQNALATGEFMMYLQPKYSLTDNSLCGAEALVRWHSVKYGFIMPDEFIPLFERNGFVNRIDLYMYEQICKMLSLQLKNGTPVVPVSFNLSRLHMLDPAIVEKLTVVRDLFRVPKNLLEIELTEGAFYANQEMLLGTLKQLGDAGFKIAVDDFGSGYSSLNLLTHIPVDILKLDRIFIKDSIETQKGRTILADVIAMAKDLGLKIVCEGVETDLQVRFLKQCQCDMVQGFLFGKPMPVEDFEKLIHKEHVPVGMY